MIEGEKQRRGEMLAEILMLRPAKRGSHNYPAWQTTWGDKSAIGLYLTVKRIVAENKLI